MSAVDRLPLPVWFWRRSLQTARRSSSPAPAPAASSLCGCWGRSCSPRAPWGRCHCPSPYWSALWGEHTRQSTLQMLVDQFRLTILFSRPDWRPVVFFSFIICRQNNLVGVATLAGFCVLHFYLWLPCLQRFIFTSQNIFGSVTKCTNDPTKIADTLSLSADIW